MTRSLRVPGLLFSAALVSAALPTDESSGRVDFARDVRPILASHCLACHGPDEQGREADLRLDTPASALADRGGFAAIVPGDPDASEAWLRVVDDDDPMPPKGEGDRLTAAELAVIKRWIEEGAEWAEHWAFAPPATIEAPPDSRWSRNDIDGFILERMGAAGLEPSQPATPETLIRRLSLDLTGLPPTPDEIDAFLADTSDAGYARTVDRLLASPRFGERFALPWLDAARYADTNGYHRDAGRTMWLWRDWLIDALNENKPYDEFLIEQLAGDLLPDATIEQQVASGFNRNHMLNDEGGAIPAEYQAEYVIDRVRTTSTVFLGLTMACSQCHDHKYDPITQEEYYRFYAFFNKLPEKGLDGSNGPAEPKLVVPTPESEAEIADLGVEIEAIRNQMAAPLPEVDALEASWARETRRALGERWSALAPETTAATGGAVLTPQPDHSLLASGPNPDSATYEVTYRTDADTVTGLWLELLQDESMAHGGVARTTHANLVVSEVEVEATSVLDPTRSESIALVTAVADYSQKKYEVLKAIDGKRDTGWAVDGHVLIENRSAIFLPERPFGYEGGTLVRVRFHQDFGTKHTMGRFRLSASSDPALAADAEPALWSTWSSLGPIRGDPDDLFRVGAGVEGNVDLEAVHEFGDTDLAWEERADLVDGQTHTWSGTNSAYYYYRTIDSPTGRTVSLSFGSDDSIVVWLNGQRIVNSNAKRAPSLDQELVDAPLRQGRNELLVKVVNYGGPGGFAFRVRAEGPEVLPAPVTAALAAAEPSTEQAGRLRDHFRRTHVAEWSTWKGRIDDLEGRVVGIRQSQPALMVMRDQPGMRPTRILERGQYDHPGREVTAGVPAFLPPIAARAGGEPDRLDLARWMVDPAHPLTARVAVNRLWHVIFGRGLVDTIENLGTQGALPSHPELLDYLARDFAESGWDTKALVREIVRSSTYRQASTVTAAQLELDPRNTLLARSPKFRLEAEFVRDAALAAAGLLHEERGGPSVKPYQPPGLWKEVSFNNPGEGLTDFYEQDSGSGLYRRSMYTFWKRSLPPPSMQTFDAPSREVCVVRRDRTNTPLQALITLNDPTYVEAARALAQLVLTSDEPDDSARLSLAFRRATSRFPDETELGVLGEFLREQRAAYAASPDAANELLGVGETIPDESLEAVELAAWTLVMSLILNLDEALTRS